MGVTKPLAWKNQAVKTRIDNKWGKSMKQIRRECHQKQIQKYDECKYTTLSPAIFGPVHRVATCSVKGIFSPLAGAYIEKSGRMIGDQSKAEADKCLANQKKVAIEKKAKNVSILDQVPEVPEFKTYPLTEQKYPESVRIKKILAKIEKEKMGTRGSEHLSVKDISENTVDTTQLAPGSYTPQWSLLEPRVPEIDMFSANGKRMGPADIPHWITKTEFAYFPNYDQVLRRPKSVDFRSIAGRETVKADWPNLAALRTQKRYFDPMLPQGLGIDPLVEHVWMNQRHAQHVPAANAYRPEDCLDARSHAFRHGGMVYMGNESIRQAALKILEKIETKKKNDRDYSEKKVMGKDTMVKVIKRRKDKEEREIKRIEKLKKASGADRAKGDHLALLEKQEMYKMFEIDDPDIARGLNELTESELVEFQTEILKKGVTIRSAFYGPTKKNNWLYQNLAIPQRPHSIHGGERAGLLLPITEESVKEYGRQRRMNLYGTPHSLLNKQVNEEAKRSKSVDPKAGNRRPSVSQNKDMTEDRKGEIAELAKSAFGTMATVEKEEDVPTVTLEKAKEETAFQIESNTVTIDVERTARKSSASHLGRASDLDAPNTPGKSPKGSPKEGASSGNQVLRRGESAVKMASEAR